jgi:hypothetical protein
VLLLAGCDDDDNLRGPVKTDGPASLDAAVDLGPAEVGVEAPPAAPSRLERPTDLPRPPNGRLPADLFPPVR